MPPTHASPDVGITRVVSMPTVVVLPAPLGPSRPKISPLCTVRSRLATAFTSPPRPWKVLVSATVRMTLSSPAPRGLVSECWVSTAMCGNPTAVRCIGQSPSPRLERSAVRCCCQEGSLEYPPLRVGGRHSHFLRSAGLDALHRPRVRALRRPLLVRRARSRGPVADPPRPRHRPAPVRHGRTRATSTAPRSCRTCTGITSRACRSSCRCTARARPSTSTARASPTARSARCSPR